MARFIDQDLDEKIKNINNLLIEYWEYSLLGFMHILVASPTP